MITARLIPSVPAANRFRSRGLALAATAGVGCALASVAKAQIIFSGPENIAANPISGTRIDLDGDHTADLYFGIVKPGKGGSGPPPLGSVVFSSGSGATGQVVATSPGGTLVAKLAVGTSVSSASSFSSIKPIYFSGAGHVGVWDVTGETGYVGFSFVSGASTYYGWAQVTEQGTSSGAIGNIIDWAYNSTPGGSITVGDTGVPVPEPATAALVAGAVVLSGALWLKRRRRSRASA